MKYYLSFFIFLSVCFSAFSDTLLTKPGKYTVYTRFDDQNGNRDTVFQVIYIRDLTPPVPTKMVLDTVRVQCRVTVTDTPTAMDRVSGLVKGKTISPLTYMNQGTFSIVWTYSDKKGNTSSQNQAVIVRDTIRPKLVGTLPVIQVDSNYLVKTPRAYDNCRDTINGTFLRMTIDSADSVTLLDSLKSFFWANSTTDTNKRGYYADLKISNKREDLSSVIYDGLLSIQNCSWWKTDCNISINLTSAKPTKIKRCSSRFNTIPWIQNVTGNVLDTARNVKFIFPVLPNGQNYVTYDYFSIIMPDTNLLFEFSFMNDSIAFGSLISKANEGRTVILERDAIAIVTKSNLIRIKSIQVKGSSKVAMSSFLNLDLSGIKNDAQYYGIEVL